MIFSLFLSFFVSYILGYLFIRFFIKAGHNSLVYLLSLGIGTGISSLLFFIWLVITGSVSNFNYFEIAFLILMAFFYLKIRTLNKHTESKEPAPSPNKILLLSFCVIAFISSISATLYSLINPYGDYTLDAINFWTGKAAFFYRSDNHHWSDILNSGNHLLNHPDYPLLIPDAVAKMWVYTGQETQLAPVLLSFAFFIMTVGFLFVFLRYCFGANHALLPSIVLAATPGFIQISMHQTADVPLGFFMLCSICLIILDRKTKNTNLPYLLGMTTGLCAWAKNEGILFFVMVVFFRFIVMLFFDGFNKVKMDFLKFFIGSLPVLAVLVYFKLNSAIANDLFVEQKSSGQLFSRIYDFSRYIYIAKNFYIYFVERLLGYPLFILLTAYAVICKIKFNISRDSGLIISGLILIGMFAGYFFVYITTPYGLEHFLEYSLERLLVQLLPSILVIYFSLVKPEKQDTPCCEGVS